MRSPWLLLFLLVAIPAFGQSGDSSTASTSSDRYYFSLGAGIVSTPQRTSPDLVIGGTASLRNVANLYSFRLLRIDNTGEELALLYGRTSYRSSFVATISAGPTLYIPDQDPRLGLPGFEGMPKKPMLVGATVAGQLGTAIPGTGATVYGFATFYPADGVFLGLMLMGLIGDTR